MKYPRYKSQHLSAKRAHQVKREYTIHQKDRPCMDCGIKYPHYVMEFDHRNPDTKVMCISAMVTHTSLDRVKAEIAKCDIVCANCHRARTWIRKQYDHPKLPLSRF